MKNSFNRNGLALLALTFLAMGSANLRAHTNKTYLTLRSHGVNAAMEHSGGFNELIHRYDKDKFGGNLQAIGFYQASTSSSSIGSYFGIKDKNVITLKKTNVANPRAEDDADIGFVLHDHDSNGVANKSTKMTLRPESNSWGFYFNYHQNLERIVGGLYLKVNLPVVHVENKMNLTVEGDIDANDVATAKNLENYLKGEYSVTTNGSENLQTALTNAKMDGSDSSTGIADIDVVLGYEFLDEPDYYASINLGVTFPTGNDADGRKVFEAIHGNGGHWGFGAGLAGGVNVWGDDKQNIKLHMLLNYRYLFKGTERRTHGIKDIDFGQYVLLGKAGDGSGKSLIPAANVLTLNTNVTPGSQLEGALSFVYNWCGFTFDAGYNIFFRESESCSLKEEFKDGVYGIAKRSRNTTGANFTLANGGSEENALQAVNKENILVAESPSQTQHKIFGSIGYIFRDWDTPVNIALGGHYEFRGSNAGVSNWGINGRVGISF